MLRFSKQLKLGLSESASASVGSSVGVMAGVEVTGRSSSVLMSDVESCHYQVCVTDSHYDTLPILAQLMARASHARRREKNIFTSICLSDKTPDQLMRTECAADTMKLSGYTENEIPLQSNNCPVSSSSSVIIPCPTITSGSCLTSVVTVSSDVEKTDHSAQTVGSSQPSTRDGTLCHRAAESTSSSPETENSLFGKDKTCAVKRADSVDLDVMEQSTCAASPAVDRVLSVDSDTCSVRCWAKADEEISLNDQEVDDEDIGMHVSAEIVLSVSNCSIIGRTDTMLDTNMKEHSELSLEHYHNAAVNCRASCDSLPVDTAMNVTNASSMLLQGSDLHNGNQDSVLPNMSSTSSTGTVSSVEMTNSYIPEVFTQDIVLPSVSLISSIHSCIEVSPSFHEDSRPVGVKISSHSSAPAVDISKHDSQMSEEHPRYSVSGSTCTKQALPSSAPSNCLCGPVVTDSVPVSQCMLSVSSDPVPVSLFCAQSSPVSVTLFHAQSCGSAVVSAVENSGTTSRDVPPCSCPSSNGVVYSSLSEISGSVSMSEIPSSRVQLNPANMTVAGTQKVGSDSDCVVSTVSSVCHVVGSGDSSLCHTVGTSDNSLCHPVGTGDSSLCHPVGTSDSLLCHPVGTDDNTTCHPVVTGDSSLCHTVDTGDSSLCHPVGTDDNTTCHPVGTSDSSLCHPVDTGDSSLCCTVGINDSSLCHTVGTSDSSSCHTVSSTAVLLSSATTVSDMSVKYSFVSAGLCQSNITAVSALPSSPDHTPQCSVSSDVSNDSILNSHQLPITNGHKTDCCIEYRKDLNISNSDMSSDNISDLKQFSITDLADMVGQVDEPNNVNILNSDVSDDNISDLSQLPITNQLEVECHVEEQEDKNVSSSEEPNESISDELIVSQILAADSSHCESLDHLFATHSSASDGSERQKWREMLSPIINSYQLSKTSEENSNEPSLCDVVNAEDADSNSFVEDSINDLIGSTDLNISHQSPDVCGIRQQAHDDDDRLMRAVVADNDDWMCDAKQVQDVLCSLLRSCHVNSTDTDNSLPLDADNDNNGDDEDAASCASSSTEVYVDLPEDLKLAGVSSRCGSPQDKDSDGTVSLLSVVLDGDGLDLMDSTSDGFQNIYTSLVNPSQLDTELGSNANIVNSGTYPNSSASDSRPTNLSAFSVEHSLRDRSHVAALLDKDHCPAVMALDTGLVKNLPCSTASISSLYDKLGENRQLPNENKAGLHDHTEGMTAKSPSCHCNQLYASRKSCRSSLRMPEKLADVDPTSPLLACRPPPLSAGRGSNTRHALEIPENTASAEAVSSEGLKLVRGKKRKHNSVSGDESRTDSKLSVSLAEMGSCDKGSRETLSSLGMGNEVGNRQKCISVKSLGDTQRDKITSKNSVTQTESCTLRIRNTLEVTRSINNGPLLCKRSTLSDDTTAIQSMLSDKQKWETVFTMERARSGSVRTIILRKSVSPPMLKTGKKCKSKDKLEQFKRQRKLNLRRSQSDIQHEEEEKKLVEHLEQTSADDDDDGNKDVSVVKYETGEELHSVKKKKKKKKRAKMKTNENAAKSCRVRKDSTCPHKASDDAGDTSSHNKSDSGNVLDGDSIRSNVSRGRPRKRCSLLAELENSEGYVADRNVSQQHSSTSSLSREERALQVCTGRYYRIAKLLLFFIEKITLSMIDSQG